MTKKTEIIMTSAIVAQPLVILPHRGQGDTVSNRNPQGPIGSSDDIKDINEMNWREFAACRGMSVDDFFAERGDSQQLVKKAKATCKNCPVKRACLVVALKQDPDSWGVFGGTTAKTRRIIRRMWRRDPNYLYTQEACEMLGLTNAY